MLGGKKNLAAGNHAAAVFLCRFRNASRRHTHGICGLSQSENSGDIIIRSLHFHLVRLSAKYADMANTTNAAGIKSRVNRSVILPLRESYAAGNVSLPQSIWQGRRSCR